MAIEHSNPSGLCGCGCGLPAPIAPQKLTKRGLEKGQFFMFRVGHSRKGRPLSSPGIYRKFGIRLQHVVIAEKALGKALPVGACVHHVDENKHNNANSNLVICQSHAYHFMLHVRARTLRAGGDPDTQKICGRCKIAKLFFEFGKDRHLGNGLSSWCKKCSSEYGKARRVLTSAAPDADEQRMRRNMYQRERRIARKLAQEAVAK